jgi:hypothetical protein
MPSIEREFYRSARGPAPGDEDTWRLVLDREAGNLAVRHEWKTARDSGVADIGVAEFLAQQGAAPAALFGLLSGNATADA